MMFEDAAEMRRRLEARRVGGLLDAGAFLEQRTCRPQAKSVQPRSRRFSVSIPPESLKLSRGDFAEARQVRRLVLGIACRSGPTLNPLQSASHKHSFGTKHALSGSRFVDLMSERN